MNKKENDPGVAMPLREYIDKYFDGNIAEFGRTQGVMRHQAKRWVYQGFIYFNGHLYGVRRKLNKEGIKI